MTGMTPYGYFDVFVLPDYDAWKREPMDVRLAFHSAVSAFHLADHCHAYFARRDREFGDEYGRKRPGKFHNALASLCPAFRIVHSVANVFKHLYACTTFEVSSGGSVSVVKYRGHELEEELQDVAIRLRDGSQVRFSSAIEPVIRMWSDTLYEAPRSYGGLSKK